MKKDKKQPEPEPEPEEPEEEPKVTRFNAPIKKVEKRFKTLVKIVDQLLVKDHEYSYFGLFLQTVIDEFRQECKPKSRRLDVDVTDHDRLLFLRQVENGDICWKIYKMSKRGGITMNINVIMV